MMKTRTAHKRIWSWLAALAGSVVVTLAGVQAAEQRPAALAEEQGVSPGRTREMPFGFDLGGSHIGVSIQDVEEADMAEPEALAEGAVVEDVRPGSPAAKAGFESGDVVVELDGERVRSARQLSRLVQETPAGRAVPATLIREGSRVEVEVVPESGPDWLARLEEPVRQAGRRLRDFRFMLPPRPPGDFDLEYTPRPGRLGAEVVELTPQLADYFGVEGGLLVTMVRARSSAAEAGLQAGDVITTIDDEVVEDIGDLQRHIAAIDPGDAFSIGVTRDQRSLSLEGRFEEDGRSPARRRGRRAI